jgi:hypothetical protein
VKPSLSGDGSVRKFKARLVVRGFSQRHGVDFDETFAPVAHQTSIRVLLAIAAQHNLQIRQIDIVGAFLNGEIQDDIFIQQPEGFVVKGQEHHVCRLNKALYGLKQAGMIWNSKLDQFLTTEAGLQRAKADPCIYFTRREADFIAIGVHVDDILFVHNNATLCQEIINLISSKFDVTDLGVPTRLLGLRVHRNEETGSISLDQEEYVQQLLTKFNMIDCNPVSTPQQPGVQLSSSSSPTTPEDVIEMKRTPYGELVGSLLWLATNTRPDICTAVGSLCRFISNPGKSHWVAAQRVLRYLAGTSSFGIKYHHQAESNSCITGYSDSDWAGDPDTRRSTSGFIFMLAGGPISWKSRLQTSVSLSSVEAEYVAMCSAGREAYWLRQLLMEIGYAQRNPIPLFEDNRGCIAISKNNRTDARTKHIDVKYHYTRELVENQVIEIKPISTADMIADVMTKSLNTPKFHWCRNAMGLTDITSRGRVKIRGYNSDASATDTPRPDATELTVGATTAT